MSNGIFKDHFSTQSTSYGRFRPEYPEELFGYLAGLGGRELVWDCACGSGQASRGLARYFSKVVATDGSAEQIANAHGPDNVTFAVALADKCPLEDRIADLVTVAQALHWFDLEAFYREVRRVVRPGGYIAVWSYAVTSVTPEIDDAIEELYNGIIGPYWPPERIHVEEGYKRLAFPFRTVAAPDIAMTVLWDFEQLMGYFGSWSAVARYKQDKGHDPLPLVRDRLLSAWGDPAKVREVSWPLMLRVGQVG
ncbi:class I SAM-dependent methyltransferase [Emcibacter nanhaiensis]|uniref:Class I SAM-dependent methyltransferase n=1 Tax=Emcibacter nanhaiensis TaxID=1505037 RepID=A0A501PGV6_9PROT|nr:class I SAM-dependent methyltransferase [Emcibacter nanhaiensis]TPD59435.1 class I SAM-dependent methyltransferase [Emcibacter nanhaiensis]